MTFAFAAAGVLAAFVLATAPARESGFLADDYYAGEQIAIHAAEHPGTLDRIATTFSRRWVQEFEVFRPLTILTIEADYALHGTDGRRHHFTNLALWVLVAGAAGLLASGFCGRGGTLAVMALALLYPAAAEAIGWLVAREDLLFTLFGLLALWSRLEWRDSVLAPLPFVALALLSKETAVILPPLLNWFSAWMPRSDETAGARRTGFARAALREIAPWLIVAAWFGARFAIFGSLGMTYNKSSYFSRLDGSQIVSHTLMSLLQLVGPINLVEADIYGIPASMVRGLLIGSSAALLVTGLVLKRQRGDGNRVLALFGMIGAPLALLSPLYGVSIALDQGRALAFPAAGWILLLGLAFRRALGGRLTRIVAAIALGLLFAASTLSLWIALRPFAEATQIAEEVLGDLRNENIPPGSDVLALGMEESPGVMRRELVVHRGAYVLSSPIASAVRPPFWPAPGLRFTTLAQGPLPDALPRPWVVSLRAREALDQPWFQTIAPGGQIGAPPDSMSPANGAEVSLDGGIAFSVRMAPARWAALDRVHVVMRWPGSAGATTANLREMVTADGTLGGRLEPAARDAGMGVIAWWVEGWSAGQLTLRTPWRALGVRAP